MILFFLLWAVGVSGVGAFAQTLDNAATIRRAGVRNVEDYQDARKLYLRRAEMLLATGKQAEAGEVYTKLGEIVQVHGSFSSAEAAYKTGISLLKQYGEPNDMRLVAALDDLGWLYVTWGKLAQGAPLLDAARMKVESARPNDTGLIRHLDTLAAYMTVTGRYSEAQKNWARALRVGELNYGPDAPEYVNVLVHCGQASALFGDYQLAEQMFLRYLATVDRISKIPDASHAVAAGELAHIYTVLRKPDEARHWFDDAMRIFNSDPEDSPLAFSIVLSYLGDFYMAQEEWSDAEAQYRRALTIQRNILGENHAVAGTMFLLSRALKKLHSNAEAKDLLTRAKAITSAEKNPLLDQTVDVMALRRQ